MPLLFLTIHTIGLHFSDCLSSTHKHFFIQTTSHPLTFSSLAYPLVCSRLDITHSSSSVSLTNLFTTTLVFRPLCLFHKPLSTVTAFAMATYQYQSLPISIPTKSQQSRYSPLQQSAYSVSPPEAAESVSSGSGMDATYSVATSSYAGSQSGDYETSSANGIDFQEYMQDRFSGAFDPLPLDRTLVIQAQT